MIAALGPALAGFSQGRAAGEQAIQRKEAFETDQQIRQERLTQERELAPLRRRALEANFELQDLNKAILQLDKKDREKMSKLLDQATTRKEGFNEAMRTSLASGDYNHLAKWVAESRPEIINPTVTRAPDGSLVFEQGPEEDRKQKVYRGRNRDPKTGALKPVTEGIGRDMPPDEEVAYYAKAFLDPYAELERKLTEDYNLEKIRATGEWKVRASEAGRIAAEDRARRAEERASAVDARVREGRVQANYSRERSRIDTNLNTEFNNALAAGMIPGLRQLGDNDLRTRFKSLVEEELIEAEKRDMDAIAEDKRPGAQLTVGKAFEAARKRVKDDYNVALKTATGFAGKLDRKVELNRASLEALSARGNNDARQLLKTIDFLANHYGKKVGDHLLNSIAQNRAKKASRGDI